MPPPPVPLQPYGESLWLVDGPRIRMLGIPFDTRMTVARLANGDVWLHSPVAATPDIVKAVSALGPVRHVVAPNKFHHLYVAPWMEQFPDATSWAGPGLAQRKPELGFERELSDEAEPEWADDLDQALFGGTKVLPEAVFLHRPTRTLIVTDILQNHDPKTESWFWRVTKGLNGIMAPDGGAPRDWRLTVRDREVAGKAAARIAAWDFERIVVCHGLCIEHEAQRRWRDAFAFCLPD